MRTVFTNDMVAHVWAQRTQDECRSQNGNFSFSGNTIYSYSTPIAKFHASKGEFVCLMDPENYSITTAGKHKSAIYRALDYGRSTTIFEVPYIGARSYSNEDVRHTENLAYLVAEYEKLRDKCKRSRSYFKTDDAAEYLESRADTAHQYAECFGLPLPDLDWRKDGAEIAAIRKAREERQADPAYQAKRERERERREERKREKARLEAIKREEREREERERWLAGERNWYHGRDRDGAAYLRVIGDTLETSQGAKVPLEHAIKAFRFVKLCRERGEEWRRNGHSLRVGHFQVDRIYANGNFHAGCHFIKWEECERIARQIGVFDESASADVLEPSGHAA